MQENSLPARVFEIICPSEVYRRDKDMNGGVGSVRFGLDSEFIHLIFQNTPAYSQQSSGLALDIVCPFQYIKDDGLLKIVPQLL
jgi:hypothetical protein